MARFNIESNISEQTTLFSQFGGVLGGLPSIFASVRGAVVALGAAIAANPIGALLTVISASLVAIGSALRDLQPVIDFFEIQLARAGAAMGFFRDTVAEFLGLGDGPAQSLRDTVNAAADLTRQTQDLADVENDLILVTARLEAQRSEALLRSADQTLSIEERISALQEAERVTNQLFEA